MSHYFIEDASLQHNVVEKEVFIKTLKFSFFTDNGVFSKKGLDFGTRSLLESLPDDISGDVLDFGCGYGPIGIYLKKTFDVEVDAVDVSIRAMNLAKKNAELNKVDINIFESNIYENVRKKYDYIITNPPIRVGKTILYKIVFDAKKYLNDGGKLYLVISKDQGAKSLMRDLEKEYKVQLVNKISGFFIIMAQN